MRLITAKFPGTCKACKCSFPAGANIYWSKATGATHASQTECQEAQAAKAAHVASQTSSSKIDASPIVEFLTQAKASGLKYPKASFLSYDERHLRLSISGERSRVPGSVQVKLDDEWVGRVEPDGTIYGRQLSSDTKLLDLLTLIATDPATHAKRYGSVTGSCSFCARALSDKGSIEVGYGPICAKRWNLPHEPKGSKPSKTIAPTIELDPFAQAELQNAADAGTLSDDARKLYTEVA